MERVYLLGHTALLRVPATPSAQLTCLRGAVGEVGLRGVPRTVDSLWGKGLMAGPQRVCGALLSQAQLPRQGHVLRFPAGSQDMEGVGPMRCRERFGGLLKYYGREAP